MSKKRVNILTIGGFDPSGGAGVLADIKTFEQHGLLGMAVNTANTVQTEDEFAEVNWIDEETILKQLDFLLNRYSFSAVKIGLIPSFSLLNKIHERFEGKRTTLVWDPILKASAGFDMKHELAQIERYLDAVDIITPNWVEAQILANKTDGLEAAKMLAEHCIVYLKGGHNTTAPGRDYVFGKKHKFQLKPQGSKVSEKHGSGCVLSSALASNIALGFPMQKACLKAKTYTTRVLESNSTLLGYHKR